jgi:hypothetical protein
MLTKSDRNLSYEQTQTMHAMWPNADKSVTTTMLPPITASNAAYVYTAPGASMTFDSDFTVTLPPPYTKPTLEEALEKARANMKNEAVKADSGKPDWSLVPFEALEGMVRVLEFGAAKYSRNNWMTNGGFSYRRVLTACIRHLFSYLGGEDNDRESGLSHIYHAQCNLLFLAMYLTNKEKFNKDDRESR